MSFPTSTISQLGVSSSITQKGVASSIAQKGVASSIAESGVSHADEFITEWDMPAGEFSLCCYGGASYDCIVNWGDGTSESIITSSGDPDRIHTYANAGTYQIRISGTFTHHFVRYNSYCTYLTKIINWGNVGFTSFEDAFSGCVNLTIIPSGAITGADECTTCENMFEDTGLTSIPATLFDNMPSVTTYVRCFCNIGVGLLGNAPELWDLTPEPDGLACFFNDTNLTNWDNIPDTWGGPLDTTAPVIESAEVGTVDSVTLVMTYGEALDPDSVPATTAFVVSAPLSDPAVSGVAIVGATVRLTLSTAILYGDTVTVSYTKPSSNPLQDVAGNDCVSLTNYAVTNNVEQLYCAEYLDVWNAFTNKPSDADAIIQNAKMLAIVAGGRYAKSERHWEFSVHTNTAGEAQLDWIDPVNHLPVTNVNGCAWDAYNGFTGNSAGTKYLRSNFVPTVDGTIIGQNNICVMIGIGTDISEEGFDIGALGTIPGTNHLVIRSKNGAGDSAHYWCNSNVLQGSANNNGKKYFALSRGFAANFDFYQNLVKTNHINNSTGLPNLEIFMLCRNAWGIPGDYSNRQFRFAEIGEYLTEGEVLSAIGDENIYLTSYGTQLY